MACVASMGLSHAIARGIFEGLWRKTGEFVRESLPLLAALLVALGLVTFVPAVTTWLPNL